MCMLVFPNIYNTLQPSQPMYKFFFPFWKWIWIWWFWSLHMFVNFPFFLIYTLLFKFHFYYHSYPPLAPHTFLLSSATSYHINYVGSDNTNSTQSIIMILYNHIIWWLKLLFHDFFQITYHIVLHISRINLDFLLYNWRLVLL